MKMKNMVPLYYQIAEEIKSWIDNGIYKSDDKIPSENELVSNFNVSKITVNKALADLVNKGLLYRIQGKGTYVSKKIYIRESNSSLSFSEEYSKKGIKLTTKIIECKEIIDTNIAKKLKIDKSAKIIKCSRIRSIDNEVIATHTSYLIKDLVGDLQFNGDNSLYRILLEKGIIPHKANEKYFIVKINDLKIAKILNIENSEPSFYVERFTRDKTGRLFEYCTSYLRWDKYSVEVKLEN